MVKFKKEFIKEQYPFSSVMTMFKRTSLLYFLLLLAVLVILEGTATNTDYADEDFLGKTKASLKKQLRKRASGTCKVIKCGKESDECDDNTVCQTNTICRNGKCSRFIAGDSCDQAYGCFDESLYCDSATSTCKPYHTAGDRCETTCQAKDGFTLVCDKSKKVCKRSTAKHWEPCAYGTICQEGSTCTATELLNGVCAVIPAVVGASCNPVYGCDENKHLYCPKQIGRCTEFPKEGERCYSSSSSFNYMCNNGLFCDNTTTCRQLKGVGEVCKFKNECKEDLTCSNKNRCVKENPDEGEYCDSGVKCTDGFTCSEEGVCVEQNGTCLTVDDCKYELPLHV